LDEPLIIQIYEPSITDRLFLHDLTQEAGHQSRISGTPETFKRLYTYTQIPPDMIFITDNEDDPHHLSLIEFLHSQNCAVPVRVLTESGKPDNTAKALKDVYPNLNLGHHRKPENTNQYTTLIAPTESQTAQKKDNGGALELDMNIASPFAPSTFHYIAQPNMGIAEASEALVDLHLNTDKSHLGFILARDVPKLETLIARIRPKTPEEIAIQIMVAISALERIKEESTPKDGVDYNPVLAMLRSSFDGFIETHGINRDAIGAPFFLAPSQKMHEKNI
jgi:hypothetical protein